MALVGGYEWVQLGSFLGLENEAHGVSHGSAQVPLDCGWLQVAPLAMTRGTMY